MPAAGPSRPNAAGNEVRAFPTSDAIRTGTGAIRLGDKVEVGQSSPERGRRDRVPHQLQHWHVPLFRSRARSRSRSHSSNQEQTCVQDDHRNIETGITNEKQVRFPETVNLLATAACGNGSARIHEPTGAKADTKIEEVKRCMRCEV